MFGVAEKGTCGIALYTNVSSGIALYTNVSTAMATTTATATAMAAATATAKRIRVLECKRNRGFPRCKKICEKVVHFHCYNVIPVVGGLSFFRDEVKRPRTSTATT